MSRTNIILIAALVFIVALIYGTLAFAQDAPVIAPSSALYDIWTIVQPIVVLVVSTVGPVLAAWISARLIALLKVKDDAAKLEIEQKLREALHQSAENAVAYAEAQLSKGAVSFAREAVINAALDYVKEKNPDTLAKLKVSEPALADIIIAKIGRADAAGG
jgi:hypothetical protein